MKKDELKNKLQEHLQDFPKSHARVLELNNTVVVEYSLMSKANKTNDELISRGFKIEPVNKNNLRSPHQYRVSGFEESDINVSKNGEKKPEDKV